MKKVSMIVLSIFVVLIFVGCDVKDDSQEKAEEFIQLYYGQYQQKDEIAAIFDVDITEEVDPQEQGPVVSSHSIEQNIKDFIDTNFNGMLTEKAQERLIANRLLPKADVLNTDITEATVNNIEFTKRENAQEGNLSFQANIDLQHEDGSVNSLSEEGTIRVVEEDGVFKVDDFRLN